MQAPIFNSHHAATRTQTLYRSSSFVRVLGAALFGWLAFAAQAYADDPDPPDRVARLSFVSGEVSVQLADANEWVAARINRPLTNNDQLWTNDGARAELQIGSSSVQLDENTQLSVLELSDNVLQLQLTQGTVNVYVRGMERDDTIEVDTPNAATTMQEPGTYRVHADDSGDVTVVQVRAGSAEVSGERQSFSLRENEQITLRGATRLSAEFDELGRLDDFDRWANARNTRGNHVIAAQYVAPDVIGYEDLDDYGNWAYEPDYGQVWIPTRVVSGWAPYRYGHWEWIAPWGWTWVDDAPWGFAPFHYGRWAYARDRWCWVPGPRAVRAVYAPALVAWVGTPGVSVAIGVGSGPVGWVPLGPREIYRPVYRVSPGYVARVNISNSLVRRDDFERRYRESPRDVNFANRAAVTVVSANALRSAQPVNRSIVRTDPHQLQPVESAPNVQPDRAGLIGGMRTIAPPTRVISREVVARRTPMPIRSDAQPGQNPPAARSNIRVVEPTTPGRAFSGERQQINPDSTQPANGQGPGRAFTRPAENATPRRSNNDSPNVNNRPENDDRVIDNNNDRGTRRGIPLPRTRTPEAPNSTPNLQRSAPPTSPEQRENRPQIEKPRAEAPAPELRNRVTPQIREQQREQPVAPQRTEPAAPQQPQREQPRAQPAPQQPQPQRAQPPQQNKSNSSASEEERRRRPRDNDTR